MKSQKRRPCSSCAACRFLKRRCNPSCPFAPYFRSDEQKKFIKVHKVFGASNVIKILNDVAEEQREETVNSLVYEAEVRLVDPVYGCIGAIASLQRKMVELQSDLLVARARLAYYATNPNSSPIDHHLNLDAFLDVPVWSGLLETFNHNKLASDESSPLNEFSSFLFP